MIGTNEVPLSNNFNSISDFLYYRLNYTDCKKVDRFDLSYTIHILPVEKIGRFVVTIQLFFCHMLNFPSPTLSSITFNHSCARVSIFRSLFTTNNTYSHTCTHSTPFICLHRHIIPISFVGLILFSLSSFIHSIFFPPLYFIMSA